MRLFLYGGRIAGIGVGFSFDLSRRSRRERSTPRGAGFVYVLRRADGEVKIGSTRNPPQRIRNLQTGSSLPLAFAYVAASKDYEAVEHDAIALMHRFRLHGDWFEASPEMAVAAVNGAAARLRAGLSIVDPIEAARHVPAPHTTLTPEERRRGTRNFFCVVVSLAVGTCVAWKIWDFIGENQAPRIPISDVRGP